MPYKDQEKRKEAQRRSQAKRRQKLKDEGKNPQPYNKDRRNYHRKYMAKKRKEEKD